MRSSRSWRTFRIRPSRNSRKHRRALWKRIPMRTWSGLNWGKPTTPQAAMTTLSRHTGRPSTPSPTCRVITTTWATCWRAQERSTKPRLHIPRARNLTRRMPQPRGAILASAYTTQIGLATPLNHCKNPPTSYLLGASLVYKMTTKKVGDKEVVQFAPGTIEAYQKAVELDPNGTWGQQAKQGLDQLQLMAPGIDTKVNMKKKKS